MVLDEEADLGDVDQGRQVRGKCSFTVATVTPRGVRLSASQTA
jgi:hypothetical protein